MNNSDALHPLTIQTDPEAHVEIFDGYDCVIHQGWGTTTWSLAPGLYTVRAELAGQQLQSLVGVPGVTMVRLTPQIYSPAPIDGAATTHEYYHDPAQYWSVRSTLKRPGLSGTGWLFIFVRLSSQNSPREGDIVQGLTLNDEEGNFLCALGESDVCERDDNLGWALLSTPIAPGFYRLRHEARQVREIFFYVYPDLSTQIFITYFQRPRLEQMRVFLHPVNHVFESSDPAARAIELALAGLQNGIRNMAETLPRNDQQDLLRGKFRNPMLGLIGAHWLLEDPSAQEDYVALVLGNLQRLLGPTPDLVALQVVAAKRFKTMAMPTERVATPPMIRRGVEILVRERPELIPEDGLFESMLPEMYLDSPWTCWRAAPLARFEQSEGAHANIEANSLDWMESAVLSAGIRGEFDVRETEPMARQFVVTPTVVRQAYKRLLLKLEGKTAAVHFNEAYLAKDQESAAKLQIDYWAVQGAAFYNQPLPAVGFPHSGAILFTEQDIVFPGSAGDVRFRTALSESQFVFGSWPELLRDFGSGFNGLTGVLPKPESDTSVFFGLLTEYDSDTARGAIALDSLGPPASPAALTFGLLTEGAVWRGLRDSFQMAASEFGLPRQLAAAPGDSHQTVLVANIDGSFQLRFETEIKLRFLHVPRSDQEDWAAAESSEALIASGVLTASGAFQVSLSRCNNDILSFSIHRAARSGNAPICLAKVQVATSEWPRWLERSAVEMERSGDRIAVTLLNMAQAFEGVVKDRAYFYDSKHKTGPKESWYRAEELETQEIDASIARVLEQKYASELRSQIERDVSGRPLLEIQVAGAQQMDILKQALDGKFDLADRRSKVNLRGLLVSLADAAQRHDVILASDMPRLMRSEGNRLVAYDSSLQSFPMAMAQIDARVATTSGPAEMSAPSATMATFFINASSRLLAAAYAPLVERWMPEKGNAWSLLTETIGSQAGGAWNAILQLKLHWAIDLRSAGGYFELEPDAIFPAIRRELRLFIPYYSFTDAAAFADLERAIPLLLYQALPTDVSSAENLELNPTFYKSVYTILSAWKAAVKGIGFSTPEDEWSLPHWMEATSSVIFQDLLARERALCDAIFEDLSRSRLAPRARAAALFSMASNIVESLTAVLHNPQEINAVRTVIFTTALSLLASSPAQVSAEMSVTAVNRKLPLLPEWIASPDSMPLGSILGHGRISATTESSSPLRRRALVAAGR